MDVVEGEGEGEGEGEEDGIGVECIDESVDDDNEVGLRMLLWSLSESTALPTSKSM